MSQENSLTFSLPQNLAVIRKPPSQKKGKFNLKSKIDTILICCSDEDQFDELNDNKKSAEFSEECQLYAIPKLYQRVEQHDFVKFVFGANGGEVGIAAAYVRVRWSTTEPPTGIDTGTETVKSRFDFKSSDVLVARPQDEVLVKKYRVFIKKLKQDFLQVNVDEEETAILSVGRNDAQRLCYAVIFDLKGNYMGKLDPSSDDPDDRVFTVAQNVWVLPLIAPFDPGGSNNIRFFVGDPKEDAEIEYGEE